jgi:hypothetical protein
MLMPSIAHAGLLALWLALPVNAQARPNFSGEWKINRGQPSKELAGQEGGTGMGVPAIKISQDGHSITLSNAGISGPNRATYDLSGRRTTNMMRASGQKIPRTCWAEWHGSRLVLYGVAQMDGSELRLETTLSLDADGVLSIESANSWRGSSWRSRATYVPGSTVVP